MRLAVDYDAVPKILSKYQALLDLLSSWVYLKIPNIELILNTETFTLSCLKRNWFKTNIPIWLGKYSTGYSLDKDLWATSFLRLFVKATNSMWIRLSRGTKFSSIIETWKHQTQVSFCNLCVFFLLMVLTIFLFLRELAILFLFHKYCFGFSYFDFRSCYY